MRVENSKVKITIPIPFDRPDKNGTMFTEDAVSNAISTLKTHLPVIDRRNDNRLNDVVIGSTTGMAHIVTWDFENQVCYMTVNGELFGCGVDIIVNDIEGNKVKDFDIVSIGLSK